MTQVPTPIESEQWLQYFDKLAADSMTWFDFLTVIDRGESMDVVARVVNSETGESALVITNVAENVSSLCTIYPGARWYERESQEMFGVTFSGLTDSRPLLRQDDTHGTPMRKSVTL